LKKEHEFIYAGEAIPKITKENHPDFILHYQKSILLSLVKRNLLTLPQFERCMSELERQK
jgi:hypothetical protein